MSIDDVVAVSVADVARPDGDDRIAPSIDFVVRCLFVSGICVVYARLNNNNANIKKWRLRVDFVTARVAGELDVDNDICVERNEKSDRENDD